MTLVPISTKAGDARMVPKAAAAFEALRKAVLNGSGVDFLSKCGDVLRPPGFRSNKDGVAMRSWHKTGRAFDYDQTSPALIIVEEPKSGKTYFHTYLRCADQSGRYGRHRLLRDYRGGSSSCYVYDFTLAAEAAGFKRVPAWVGWQSHYNRREFWHYQFDEGLTWDAAMAQVKGASDRSGSNTRAPIIGLNDRDANTNGMVSKIQDALAQAHYLPLSEVDGIFGRMTFEAVRMLQRQNKLTADGRVGPQTLAVLKLNG